MATGENWAAEECDAIVADYFAMLRDEQAGRPYNKTEHRKALMLHVDRTKGSIEKKHPLELAIVEFERMRLASGGRSDLADKVCHVSVEQGDGAGFDIASFEVSGAERLIEVKTTLGKAQTPFFMSRNERSFAEDAKDRYQLYRVHEFGPKPALFMLKPPLDRAVRFSTEVWRAEV